MIISSSHTEGDWVFFVIVVKWVMILQIVVLLLASGVGAGFAVSFELRKIAKQLAEFFADIPGIQEEKTKDLKFLDKINIATALLLVACFCMALLSLFSSINRSTTTRGFFFKWYHIFIFPFYLISFSFCFFLWFCKTGCSSIEIIN